MEWVENFDDLNYADHFNVGRGGVSNAVSANADFPNHSGNGAYYRVYTTTALSSGETTPYFFGTNNTDLGRRYKFDLWIGPETGSPRHDAKNFKLIQFGDGTDNTLYLRKLETADPGPFYQTDLNTGAVQGAATPITTPTLRLGIGNNNGALFLINDTDLDQYRGQWITVEIEADCNPSYPYLKVWINGQLDFFRNYGTILQNCFSSQRYFGSFGLFDPLNSGKFSYLGIDNFYKFDTIRPNDAVPPVRSNPLPSAITPLPFGTTSTEISLDTDENAVCRYSIVDTDFFSMNDFFGNTGFLHHATVVSGLITGTNTYYVRCRDEAGNYNTTSFPIQFDVSSGSIDTAPPLRFNGQPNIESNHFPYGTTEVLFSLSTNENAVCRFAATASLPYGSMTTMLTTGGANHSHVLSGLVPGNYEYDVKCEDFATTPNANPDNDNFPITFTIDTDIDPPLIGLLSPEPGIPVTASTDELSLHTDETSVCKYATVPGTSFASMSLFASTDGTSHTQPLTGLILDGRTYKYYVRCSDGVNVSASDYGIDFTMVDEVAPALIEVSAVQPNPTSDNTPGYSFSSTEAGTITYGGSCSAAVTAADVDTNTIIFNALADGTYADCTVKVTDSSQNESSPLPVTAFTVDTVAPLRSAGAPSGTLPIDTVATTLTVTTNENATCRYATTAGASYASMINTFTGSGSTSHSAGVSGLVNGASYSYFVRCSDAAGNASGSDYPISFSVGSDTQAPILSAGSPSGTLAVGTRSASLTVTTNENASCRYTTTAGTAYGSMSQTFTTTGGTGHSQTLTGIQDGMTYNYSVRCQDQSGNPNGSDYLISFSVAADSAAPVRSAGSPATILASGTTGTTLSIMTDESATCRYATTAGTAYGGMTLNFTTTGGTSHSQALSGLADGTTYTYYIRCQDTSANLNANSNDYSITFSVSAAASAGGAGGSVEDNSVSVDIRRPSSDTVISSEEYTFKAESDNADSVAFYYKADGSDDKVLIDKDGSDSDGVYAVTVDVRDIFRNGKYTLYAEAKNDDDEDSDKASFSVDLPALNSGSATATAETAAGSTPFVAPPSTATSSPISDSDQDGIPDAEETRLGTSLTSADSDGDGVPDEKEILAGTDPLKKSTDSGGDKIEFEDVRIKGKESSGLEVKKVSLPSSGGRPGFVRLEGKGKPLSFVTIYVYSEQPVVMTVKTAADGSWSVDLDQDLADGEHEAYVAITDRTGKVSQKSRPIAFVKTAQAVSMVSLVENDSPQSFSESPLERTKSSTKTYFLIGGGVLAFLILAFAVIGVVVKKKETE